MSSKLEVVLAEEDKIISLEENEEKIVSSLLTCVAKYGYSKTSVEDIAKEAKLSRATVYRYFGSGKDGIANATLGYCLNKFEEDLIARLEGVRDMESAVLICATTAYEHLDSYPALKSILELQPEKIWTHLAFDELDKFLNYSNQLGLRVFTRWVNGEVATRIASWLTRVVLTYFFSPPKSFGAEGVKSIERVVKEFVLPAVKHLKEN